MSMDRHHQRDHRARERKPQDAVGDHRQGHQRRRESERIEKRSSKVLPRSAEISSLHLGQSLVGPALSGDKDYVRRWLIHNEQEQSAADERSKGVERPHRREDDLLNARLNVGHFAHGQFAQEDSGERRKYKRKQNSSSDSSLLEVPVPPKPQRSIPENRKDEPLERRQHELQIHKKRKAEPIESDTADLSDQSSPPKETFEKRARHKTKEDRYEPKKKRHRSAKTVEKKRSTTKPEKRRGRKKTAKEAGEDFIRNFSSKSIGQERLTVSSSPGMNSRHAEICSFDRLTGLACSRMGVHLPHLNVVVGNRTAPGNNPDKINPRSREKEKQKAVRAQDEISTFFKPTKTPLAEFDPNTRGRTSSTITAPEVSFYERQIAADKYHNANGRSHYLEPTREQALTFRQGSSSGRLLELRETSLGVNYTERPPDSTSRISGNANTYITWSESQFSPRTTEISRQLRYTSRQRSSTPESIRQSLQETGIYRDTGIHEHSESRSFKEVLPKAEQLQQHREPDHGKKARKRFPRGGTSGITTPSELPMTRSSNRDAGNIPSHTQRYQRTRSPQNAKTPETGPHDKRPHEYRPGVTINDGKKDSAMRDNQRIIVEHFDSELGWHRRPSSRLQEERLSAELKKENEREAKSTPITREQFAKLARIKRPATTLPIVHLPELERSKKNTPLVVDQPDKGPSTGASAEKAFCEEQPIPTPPRELNTDEGGPASKVSRLEGTMIPQPRSNQPNVRFAQGVDPKEGEPVPPLVNSQNQSRAQQTMGASPKEIFDIKDRDPYLGLPVRGGWSTRTSTPAFQPVRQSPFVVPEPLFIHQVPKTHTPREDYIQYGSRLESGNFFNPAASDFDSNLRVGDPPYKLSANQGAEIFQHEEAYNHAHEPLAYQGIELVQEQDDYEHQLYNYTHEEVEENSPAYTHETQMWGHEEGYVDEVENFDMPIEQGLIHQYKDVPSEEVFVSTEGLEQNYNNSVDDGSYAARGFWKSCRLY
ncbi:hypothetical protein LOCC1_G005395 [Lachnellula occidentalis]|uniref:Uncharacterized protein n=1 Tax=Lachnellula occidentalis TaxID=215460 RepID=A0A8H8RLC9_9HELO|nr:hypothetical protein LOCC1_G005395 [Lachnellula occidentalis]